MNRQLHTITVQPVDLLFLWTVRVQLTNFRKHGFLKNKYTAIVWVSYDKIHSADLQGWYKLASDFPEIELVIIYDNENFLRTIQAFNYIPLLRPHCLRNYFASHPECKQEAIFYIDADVILTKPLDLSKFLDDNINYVSQAGSYINASYFDSKINDVKPNKLEQYKKIDVLDNLAKQIGINRTICEQNNDVSGAAQYLLKNIDAKYWADVEDACMLINIDLGSINKTYFESENKGFQKWCADIWAVIWNLWKRNAKTECPPELDFLWATDDVSKWENCFIYHDAGATRGDGLFNKRKLAYVNNLLTPFDDYQYLEETNKEFCSYKYVQEIKNANPKI